MNWKGGNFCGLPPFFVFGVTIPGRRSLVIFSDTFGPSMGTPHALPAREGPRKLPATDRAFGLLVVSEKLFVIGEQCVLAFNVVKTAWVALIGKEGLNEIF